jgi:Mg-chelatase subunit ChlD
MNIETILSRPSIRGLEFRQGLEAFAHKVGQSLGLSSVRVEWRSDISTAGINGGGNLYLAGVVDEAIVNRALVVKYAGFVVHELLHHKYTDFLQRFESLDESKTQYIRTLHNAVEDGWIENTAIASGLLGNINSLLTELIDSMTRDALAKVSDWNDARQYPYILAVACRKHASIKVPCNPRLTAIFTEAARRCGHSTSTSENLKIAEWVYDQIQQESQKPKDGPTKPKKGATRPEKQEGKGKGAGKEEKPSDGPSTDGGDAPGTAPDAPVDSPVNKLAESVEPTLESGGVAGAYSKDRTLQDPKYALGLEEMKDLINVGVPAKLRYEVKRLFDNSGLTEFSRNRKAGVVNVHALPSVATGNDRVFKRRLDVEGVDSAVVILLDISGSMFSKRTSRPRRIAHAVMACRALLDTLSAAGVATSVVGFGTYIYEIKPFGMNHKIANGLIGRVTASGATNDYTALRYAHELLAKRHENRKMVFSITDGRGFPDGVRQQVKSGNALGVTTVGIGIESDVSDIYGNAVEVCDVADIGNVSFKQIKLAA